jgi:hypothetical protein
MDRRRFLLTLLAGAHAAAAQRERELAAALAKQDRGVAQC